MLRDHPPGENSGKQPETEGSPPAQNAPARDDAAFMEEVVRELAEQNDHARSEEVSTPDPKKAETERPRTVRVDRDSGFRTPEGVSSARAYLPAKTVAPGHSEPVEIETVKVEDPRRMPTIRIPRQRKEVVSTEGKGRVA